MNKYFIVTFKSGDIRFYTIGKTYYYLVGTCTVPIVVVDIFTLCTLLTRQGYGNDVSKVELAHC